MNAAERDQDRAELLGYLERLAENGRRVPCRDATPDEASAWTSDDPDDQGLAARLCVGCAGAKRCDAYGLRWPREHGVYGGRTNAERQTATDQGAA